jgi:hypothetical protein
MSEFTEQLRQPSGYASLDEERRRAADELDRLQEIIDALRPEAGYGRVFDDYVATVPIVREFWKRGSLQERVQGLREDRDRLQAIVDRLPKSIVDKLSKHDTIKECQKESISPGSVLED